jgi:hypothetical protein
VPLPRLHVLSCRRLESYSLSVVSSLKWAPAGGAARGRWGWILKSLHLGPIPAPGFRTKNQEEQKTHEINKQKAFTLKNEPWKKGQMSHQNPRTSREHDKTQSRPPQVFHTFGILSILLVIFLDGQCFCACLLMVLTEFTLMSHSSTELHDQINKLSS